MLRKSSSDRLLYAITVTACLLVYVPVVFPDFQRGWDDGWEVMNMFTVLGFTPENLKTVFTEFYVAQYSPFNSVIYMVIYAIFGYSPAAFHLYPLLLHISNSCLVLLFIQRLFGKNTNADTVRRVAFITALLFAVHPLQVESIAWISASKIPLYTFFTLLAMITWIKYVDTGKIRYYVGVFVLFVFSYGCKEQTVVLPFTLLLLDVILCRSSLLVGEKAGDNASSRQSLGYLLLEKLPFLLFAFFGSFIMYVNQSATAIAEWAGYPFHQRIVFTCYSLADYFGKLIIPAKLLYMYPFPMAPGRELPVHFHIYPVIICSLPAFIIKTVKRSHRPVIFGLLFYLINMILVLHLVAMSRPCIVADRYVYLGSVGLFFMAAWYGVSWWQRQKGRTRKWAIALALCYMLYLGGYAHYRTYAWKDSATLKKEVYELLDKELLKQYRYE